MTAAQLLAWLALWPVILDGHPHQRKPRNPIPCPPPLAAVMVDAALESAARTGLDAETFLAFEYVWFAHESGYHVGLAGDCPGMPAGDPKCTRDLGARSCGIGQSPCRITPKGATALEEARISLRILESWMTSCPSYALQAYSGNGCRDSVEHFRRDELRAVLATPKPGAP